MTNKQLTYKGFEMKRQEMMNRYQQLSAELFNEYRIAVDIDSQDSDTVIRARKEIARIKNDIFELLNAMESA